MIICLQLLLHLDMAKENGQYEPSYDHEAYDASPPDKDYHL